MNDTSFLGRLMTTWSAEYGLSAEESKCFVRALVELLTDSLKNEGYVRIKGLGTFRLIQKEIGLSMSDRGESNLTFTPDDELKLLINKPFAHFEPVPLNPHTHFEDVEAVHAPVLREMDSVVERFSEDSQEETEVVEEDGGMDERAEVFSPPVSSSIMEVKEESETLPNKAPFRKKRWPLLFLTLILLLLCTWGGYVIFRSYEVEVAAIQARTTTPVPGDILHSEDEFSQVWPDSVKVMAHDSLALTMSVASSDGSAQKKDDSVSEHSGAMTAQYIDSARYEIVGTQTVHVVAEGETLVRISLKYYGTKAMWIYIYEHNRTTISNPDNVPYGTALKIPVLKKQE